MMPGVEAIEFRHTTATCSSDVLSGPREPARPRLFPASQAPETAAPDLFHLPDDVVE